MLRNVFNAIDNFLYECFTSRGKKDELWPVWMQHGSSQLHLIHEYEHHPQLRRFIHCNRDNRGRIDYMNVLDSDRVGYLRKKKELGIYLKKEEEAFLKQNDKISLTDEESRKENQSRPKF